MRCRSVWNDQIVLKNKQTRLRLLEFELCSAVTRTLCISYLDKQLTWSCTHISSWCTWSTCAFCFTTHINSETTAAAGQSYPGWKLTTTLKLTYFYSIIKNYLLFPFLCACLDDGSFKHNPSFLPVLDTWMESVFTTAVVLTSHHSCVEWNPLTTSLRCLFQEKTWDGNPRVHDKKVTHHPLLRSLSAYLALLHKISPWRSDPRHCIQGVWIGAPCFPPYNYSFQVHSPHRCCSLCVDHGDQKWNDLTYIVRRN